MEVENIRTKSEALSRRIKIQNVTYYGAITICFIQMRVAREPIKVH